MAYRILHIADRSPIALMGGKRSAICKPLNHIIGKCLLLLIVAALLLIAGCAKSVTPLFPLGKTITFDINFKENIDTAANRYYVIMRCSAAPRIPFTPIEFVEPSETPSQPDVNYFADYYSTWDNYLVLEGNTIYLAPGPFVSTEAVTRETVAIWNGSETKKIQVSFDISRLNLPANLLYFDFVTVDHSSRIVRDNLSKVNNTPSSQYIDTNYSGTFVNGSDEATEGIPCYLDILNWSVTVQ